MAGIRKFNRNVVVMCDQKSFLTTFEPSPHTHGVHWLACTSNCGHHNQNSPTAATAVALCNCQQTDTVASAVIVVWCQQWCHASSLSCHWCKIPSLHPANRPTAYMYLYSYAPYCSFNLRRTRSGALSFLSLTVRSAVVSPSSSSAMGFCRLGFVSSSNTPRM